MSPLQWSDSCGEGPPAPPMETLTSLNCQASAPERRVLAPRIDANTLPREADGRLWLQIFRLAGLEWTRVELPLPNLPPALEGLRILHLTDFHLRKRWYKAFDEL